MSANRSAECLFKVEWQADGSVAILASNNNYIYNKQTGSLVAGSDVVCEKACFQLKIINRPILVLKSDHGFVGTSVGSRADVICCNRAAYEVIGVEVNTDGSYFFKGWCLTFSLCIIVCVCLLNYFHYD